MVLSPSCSCRSQKYSHSAKECRKSFGIFLQTCLMILTSLGQFGISQVSQADNQSRSSGISKMTCTFWLVLKLEISHRVLISWRILVSVRGFFLKIFFFFLVKYLSFHNSSSSFALRYLLFHVNGKAIVWHAPCFIWLFLKMFFSHLEELSHDSNSW
jgi:hypothetical protein